MKTFDNFITEELVWRDEKKFKKGDIVYYVSKKDFLPHDKPFEVESYDDSEDTGPIIQLKDKTLWGAQAFISEQDYKSKEGRKSNGKTVNKEIDVLERKKKTDEQIIDRLISETKNNTRHWYFVGKESEIEFLYTKVRKEVEIRGTKTIIDTIFKISDQLIEEEDDDEIYSEFQYPSQKNNIITLEIYISKNNKKEIFCRRISSHQLKLSDLVGVALPIAVKKPDKK